GPGEGAVAADLEVVGARRVLVEEEVRIREGRRRREGESAVAREVHVAAGGGQARIPWICAVRVVDEDVVAGDDAVAGGVHAGLEDVDARIHEEGVVTGALD